MVDAPTGSTESGEGMPSLDVWLGRQADGDAVQAVQLLENMAKEMEIEHEHLYRGDSTAIFASLCEKAGGQVKLGGRCVFCNALASDAMLQKRLKHRNETANRAPSKHMRRV
jgi:hypothetical protein